MQILIIALGAEGALEGADVGRRRVGGQIPVTALAVGSEFKHGKFLKRKGEAGKRAAQSTIKRRAPSSV
ncbi:hypothetical protein KAM344_24310 [Aeromonas caviae]|nr:hypothetical protein KAM344_24310 [Aeromonas caviae]